MIKPCDTTPHRWPQSPSVRDRLQLDLDQKRKQGEVRSLTEERQGAPARSWSARR